MLWSRCLLSTLSGGRREVVPLKLTIPLPGMTALTLIAVWAHLSEEGDRR